MMRYATRAGCQKESHNGMVIKSHVLAGIAISKARLVTSG